MLEGAPVGAESTDAMSYLGFPAEENAPSVDEAKARPEKARMLDAQPAAEALPVSKFLAQAILQIAAGADRNGSSFDARGLHAARSSRDFGSRLYCAMFTVSFPSVSFSICRARASGIFSLFQLEMAPCWMPSASASFCCVPK